MKILHIGKYYPPFHGGMEYFLHDLARAQANLDIRVRVFVHNHKFGGSLQQESAPNTLQIIRTPSYGKLIFAPISPAFGLHLKQQIDQFKPDLLHIHLPNPSAFHLLYMANARRIPWVIHWQSDVITPQSSPAIRLAYPFYRPFEQAMLQRTHAIIATSPPYLKSSITLARWQEKCHIIPLGIDEGRVLTTPYQTPDKSRERLPFHILAIGRLTYYKGFDILLHALAELPNARLTLIGEGDQKMQLKSLIKKLGISKRVKLLNNLSQQDLATQIKECDCLCLPSIERTEAFGMVLMEAMAHGKAVVATNVKDSGMSWVVKKGFNGLLAEPGNPQSLALELNTLMIDHDYNRKLGVQGREDFCQRFRISKVAEKISTLYTTCISSFVRASA